MSEFNRAEALLRDSQIQAGMRRFFAHVDHAYDLADRVVAERRAFSGTLLTASGAVIELAKFVNDDGSKNAYKYSFFDLEAVKDPDFTPEAIFPDRESVLGYRGNGTDIVLPGGEPGEVRVKIDGKYVRNTIHIPAVKPSDVYTFRGELAEPFGIVRQRAGVEL